MLIPHYLCKGADFSVHSEEPLDPIADLLNNRPPAVYGFYLPIAVYQATLDKLNQPNCFDTSSFQEAPPR